MDSLTLLLHPVRLRIVHTMTGGQARTTADLCARLPDVPKTTVYRHVGLLAEGGLLEVVDEQRVHGAVERHYRLRGSRARIASDAAAAMTTEDHRRAFAAAVAALLGDFNTYLDRDGADPTADLVSYAQVPLWLSKAELAEMLDRMREEVAARAHNQPAEDRNLYLLSPILFPIEAGAPVPGIQNETSSSLSAT